MIQVASRERPSRWERGEEVGQERQWLRRGRLNKFLKPRSLETKRQWMDGQQE